MESEGRKDIKMYDQTSHSREDKQAYFSIFFPVSTDKNSEYNV